MKKRYVVILCILSLYNLRVFAQVGIGTTNPSSSAILDLTSSDKGFLMPRTDTASITNPTTSLMIFDTIAHSYYFYTGSYWKAVGGGLTGSILDSFNGARTIKRTGWAGVTGLNVGTTTNVGAFLNAVFFPFVPAIISINASVTYEVGTSNNVPITGSTTRNDETIFSNGRVDRTYPSTLTVFTFLSQTSLWTVTPVITFVPDQSVTSSLELRFVAYQTVDNNGSPTVINSATKTVRSIYPYFWGSSTTDYSTGGTAIYTGLTKYVQTAADKSVTYATASNVYLYFAYPASYGPLTSILDQNSFQQITAFTRYNASVTSTGLVNNWTTNYIIYKSNNPASPTGWVYQFIY
jgi:hypothetical protein